MMEIQQVTSVAIPYDQRIDVSGIGLHSGKLTEISLIIANQLSRDDSLGIMVFSNNGRNHIDINPFNVIDTKLCTVIGNKVVSVSTIEHMMAAFWAYGLTNVLMTGMNIKEIPILDGSAKPWCDKLSKYFNIIEYNSNNSIIIDRKIRVQQGDSYLEVEPYDSFYVDITIDFPYKSIGKQRYSSILTPDIFVRDLSFCRTFVHKNDAMYLKMNGMALGGSLDNAIVVDDSSVLNPEGLRVRDEFVKHKVLDLVGDLWTIGKPIMGKITGYKPGHAINNLLARKIWDEYVD